MVVTPPTHVLPSGRVVRSILQLLNISSSREELSSRNEANSCGPKIVVIRALRQYFSPYHAFSLAEILLWKLANQRRRRAPQCAAAGAAASSTPRVSLSNLLIRPTCSTLRPTPRQIQGSVGPAHYLTFQKSLLPSPVVWFKPWVFLWSISKGQATSSET